MWSVDPFVKLVGPGAIRGRMAVPGGWMRVFGEKAREKQLGPKERCG